LRLQTPVPEFAVEKGGIASALRAINPVASGGQGRRMVVNTS
jgi:hypothetical protein